MVNAASAGWRQAGVRDEVGREKVKEDVEKSLT